MYSLFNPTKSTYSVEDYASIFIYEIVCRHGISLSIISYRGTQFTSIFLRSFLEFLGTKEDLSSTLNPQIDGQAKQTIQTLEDMLRACINDSREIGISICLWWSFHTIIVFIHPFYRSL